MADRAVSDVLGFILVFSLISLAVGIVSLTGFAGLNDRRDAEQVNNAERAFEILADNVEDIYRRSAPRRSTEIDLAGAQLSSAAPTTVEVTITNLSPQPLNVKVLHPVRYSAPGGTTLVYENGAVIREDPNGEGVMKREPNLVFSNPGVSEPKTAIIPIIATSKTSGIGGETTALIRTQSGGSAVLDRYDSGTYDVQLRIATSPARAVIWERYLDAEIETGLGVANACGVSGNTVTCSFSVDQVSVTSTRIDVEFT